MERGVSRLENLTLATKPDLSEKPGYLRDGVPG
jgi:hypothetical protein